LKSFTPTEYRINKSETVAVCSRRTDEKRSFGRREKHFILERGRGKLQNFVRRFPGFSRCPLDGSFMEIKKPEL